MFKKDSFSPRAPYSSGPRLVGNEKRRGPFTLQYRLCCTALSEAVTAPEAVAPPASGSAAVSGTNVARLPDTHLDDCDAGKQQQQRNPLNPRQRLFEHQDAEESRGEDLQLVRHLGGATRDTTLAFNTMKQTQSYRRTILLPQWFSPV